MHVARRGLHTQLSLRRALLLVTAALMIIVGLLGMHTFTSNAMGHGVTADSSPMIASDHATGASGHDNMPATTVAQAAAACDDMCLTAPAGGHSDMLSACILALLAGLILLLRPLLAHRLGNPTLFLTSWPRQYRDNTLSRAPSLIVLSISRT